MPFAGRADGTGADPAAGVAAGDGPGAAAPWAGPAARWVGGASVDWAAYWPQPPRVAAFPGHPQQRRRIWWQPATPVSLTTVSAPVSAPVAAVPEPVTVATEVLGEAIRGHHVGGRRILPGAAVPELVRTALPGLCGAATRFAGLTWHRPLDLDRTAEVRVVAGDHRPGEPVPFTLTDPDGVVHATGTALALPGSVLPSAAAPAPSRSARPWRPPWSTPASAPAASGTTAAYRCSRRCGPARGVSGRPGRTPAAPGVLLDPVVLDGALQALAVLDDATGYLPTAFVELTAGPTLPARCRVHARDVTAPGTTGSRTVDLDVFDGAEHVLALRGLTLTAVGAPAARPAAGRKEEPVEPAVTIRHRRPRWQPAGPPEPGRRPVHRVLLHCEDRGPADRPRPPNSTDAASRATPAPGTTARPTPSCTCAPPPNPTWPRSCTTASTPSCDWRRATSARAVTRCGCWWHTTATRSPGTPVPRTPPPARCCAPSRWNTAASPG
ncbi:hypothetical protein GCM10020254_76310 [Streptomyces goshikiensis]